jgi:hypothetical protein
MNISNEHVSFLNQNIMLIDWFLFFLDRIGMENDLPTSSDIERDLEMRRMEVRKDFI